MKQFTKYIVILIATVVLLAACQNKPENGDKGSNSSKSVSYTHLTLPTNREV